MATEQVTIFVKLLLGIPGLTGILYSIYRLHRDKKKKVKFIYEIEVKEINSETCEQAIYQIFKIVNASEKVLLINRILNCRKHLDGKTEILTRSLSIPITIEPEHIHPYKVKISRNSPVLNAYLDDNEEFQEYWRNDENESIKYIWIIVEDTMGNKHKSKQIKIK